MTPREAQALRFIERYQAAHHGASPTLEQISDELGIVARSNAHRLLVALERQGRITREPGKVRAITVCAKAGALATISDSDLIAECVRRFGRATISPHVGGRHGAQA